MHVYRSFSVASSSQNNFNLIFAFKCFISLVLSPFSPDFLVRLCFYVVALPVFSAGVDDVVDDVVVVVVVGVFLSSVWSRGNT